MPLDVRDFNRDSSPNPALYKMADTIQENKRYQQERDYRHQKDQEADDWRKMNMIQDLTDLSKHQTSNDVANSVGNQKAAEILQKYTAAAKNLSPAELQGKITQEMSGVINGLDGLKNELDMSEAQLKTLKQRFPTLDTGQLAQVHRQDILHRRMDGNMNFINPMQVTPSEVDLSNPEFLSNFVSGNKTLTDAIIAPKGVEDTSVLIGSPDSHTTFTAKQPFWKKPNFDPAKLKDGYLTGKEIPQLQIRGSELPSDALPASNGKPFKLVDKDVYDRFAQDDGLNMELIAATRQKFQGYDKFNPTEKEYAKRNVLYSNIEALDQTNFHPTGGTKPARTTVRVNTGGSKDAAKADANNWLTNTDAAIKSKDINSINENFRILERGGRFVNVSAKYDKSGNVEVEYSAPQPDGDLKTFYRTFKNDANLPNQLKGIYQSMTGEDKVFEYSQPQPQNSKMVTMVLPNGTAGQIPEDKVADFLKDNPKAKRQ